MRDFFSKLWVKITAISLAILLFLFSILFLLNSFAPYNPKCYHMFGVSGIFGSINRLGKPGTYYQVEKTSNIIELVHLRPNNSEVGCVWINVSDMEDDSDIYLYNYISSTINPEKPNSLTFLNVKELTGKELVNDKDGWICIYDSNENPDPIGVHFYIGSKSKMRIREIVFVHENGKVMDYVVKGLVRRGNAGNSKEEVSASDSLYEYFDYSEFSSSTNYTPTFTPKMHERIKSLVNLNDEQKTFDE